jgi:hypothetical protein
LGVLKPLEGRGEGEEVFLYGYNVDEVELEPLTDIHYKPEQGEAKLQSIATSNPEIRRPAMIGLNSMIEGAAFFRPNTTDPLSAGQGALKRLWHDRPPLNRRLLRKLKKFVGKWCRKHLTPLTVDDVLDFEAWLEQVNQPLAVKEEYRKAYQQFLDSELPASVLKRKKGFVKKEFYQDPKYHRIISSPDNLEKVVQGPLAHAIEEKLFALPFFIKKIPREHWPKYIADICEGEGLQCYNSDYESFEASFVVDIKRAVELQMAEYMLQNFLAGFEAQDILSRTCKITIMSKLFVGWMKARRHSGEMTTSLFNGFSNLVVNAFIALKVNGATIFKGVVEGDDGLFVHNGRQPTREQFKELGFLIKILHVDRYFESSFCGVVFHPESMRTLANPWKALLTVSWASDEYLRCSKETRRMLGIVKGLSYLAQYPGCPVIHSISKWLLRVNGFERSKLEEYLLWYESQRATGWWERANVKQIRKSSLEDCEPNLQDRLLVAKLFDMSEDMQLELERRLNLSTGSVYVGDIAPEKYVAHWMGYVRSRRINDEELHIPYLARPLRVITTPDCDDLRKKYYTPDIKLHWMKQWG